MFWKFSIIQCGWELQLYVGSYHLWKSFCWNEFEFLSFFWYRVLFMEVIGLVFICWPKYPFFISYISSFGFLWFSHYFCFPTISHTIWFEFWVFSLLKATMGFLTFSLVSFSKVGFSKVAFPLKSFKNSTGFLSFRLCWPT